MMTILAFEPRSARISAASRSRIRLTAAWLGILIRSFPQG